LNDCWTEDDHQRVLEEVKNYFATYVQQAAQTRRFEGLVANLTGLAQEDQEELAKIHMLLSREAAEFKNALAGIIANISHSTQLEATVQRSMIRGRIDWNLTLKQRLSTGHNPSIFVCKPPYRLYDLPENQLVKYLVEAIRVIKNTTSMHSIEEKPVDAQHIQRWTDIISDLVFNTTQYLRHAYLREVSSPNKVSHTMLLRACKHRNKAYEKAARAYEALRKLVLEKNPEALLRAIQERVLTPMDWDTLFELYVLFRLIELLESAYGEPARMHLVSSKTDIVAQLAKGGKTIRIRYQNNPLTTSRYKSIFEAYDIEVARRRPDLMIEVDNGEKTRYLLIEVKRTSDRGYIADSAYKVLGYLNDFHVYFPEDQRPQGFLVVWRGIAKKPGFGDEVLEIVTHEGLNTIISTIQSLLSDQI